jgi:hypothetical protein
MRLLLGVAKHTHNVIMIDQRMSGYSYLYLRRREATLANKIKKNVKERGHL